MYNFKPIFKLRQNTKNSQIIQNKAEKGEQSNKKTNGHIIKQST